MGAVKPSVLVDAALEETGLDDVGSPHFFPLLEAICDDLDHPRLSERGRAFARRQVVRDLSRRLRINDFLDRHPDVRDTPLPPVVLISGVPRSGTTLLHNLVLRHPLTRGVQRWELVEPLPPPEAATYATDPRIAVVDASLAPLRGTPFQQMHWVEATDPEEDQWGFTDLQGLLGRGAGFALQAWALHAHDSTRSLRPTFEEFRNVLQLLLWRNPLPPQGILVLKDPTTTHRLADFIDVMDPLAVIACHRDPVRTVVSACALGDAVARPLLRDDVDDAAGDGAGQQHVLRQQAAAFDAVMQVREQDHARVVDIRYPDLMADPTGVVTALAAELDLPDPDDVLRTSVRDYLEWQRHGGRATPPAAYPMYGYVDEEVRSHPVVARYLATFGLPPERDRLVQPA